MRISCEGEICDIGSGVAESCAYCTDNSRAVVVSNDEEVANDIYVEIKFVDLNDARGSTDHGAGDTELLVSLAQLSN